MFIINVKLSFHCAFMLSVAVHTVVVLPGFIPNVIIHDVVMLNVLAPKSFLIYLSDRTSHHFKSDRL